MLTSITPLGERGRGNRWGHTASWLVFGHVVGGAALGALMALSGTGLQALLGRPATDTTTVVIAVATGIAVLGDLGGVRVPGRRQVDERWLTTYRGWVYGFGFGAQLGFGLVTVVNTLLVGVVVLAGVVLPPGAALALGVVYGLARGVGAAAGVRVRSVGDLRRLHRLLDQGEQAVRWSSLGAAALVAAGVVVLS